MPTITLQTEISAPVEVCFNLSRSIDLHVLSTAHTGEQAIAGKTSGMIGLNESVTWRAKHLGMWQQLTSKITALQQPDFFVDEMTEGAFKSMWHEHRFTRTDTGTLMTDTFRFESPYGVFGKLFNAVFLTGYMRRLLMKRNALIKEYAESGKWREVIW